MKLGFHYHVPVYVDCSGKIFTSSPIGVFIESLSPHFTEIYLFCHSATENERKLMEYELTIKNVKFIDIGRHYHLARRMIMLPNIQAVFAKHIRCVDVFLIRAPSPLLPLAAKLAMDNKIPLSYLVVGDYLKSLAGVNLPLIKKRILQFYFNINKRFQDKYAQNALLFANNPVSANEYLGLAKSVVEIRTTSLSEREVLFSKQNRLDRELLKENVQLLCAGRIEPGKGIDDVILAMWVLKNKGIATTLNLVGWEDKVGYLDKLMQLALKLGLDRQVIFHGKKTIGEELLTMYRHADIFIVASKGNEGFPRTIWESASQFLPIIASKIGAIPHILKDKENALLFPPGDYLAIAERVQQLVNNDLLASSITEKALQLAKSNTLEKQAMKLSSEIKAFVNRI